LQDIRALANSSQTKRKSAAMNTCRKNDATRLKIFLIGIDKGF